MPKEYGSKDLNYNFKDPKDPDKVMGKGEFANMPRDAKFLKFKNEPTYRGGNINSFTADVEEVSDIYENRRDD